MARHSYNIANGTGAAVREELNKALAAIQSVNSGSGSPSPATAYQYFIDESATPALIKQRNAANDGDILLGEVDGQAYFSNGTQSKPSISFRDDTDLGLRRNAADKLSIVTNGADRVTVDSSGNGVSDPPAADLHVQNTGNAVAQLTAGASNVCTIRFGDTDDANIGKIEYNNSSNLLAFNTNNSTKLVIKDDGKCGIGIVTPTELLHVAGNIKTTGNIVKRQYRPAVGTSGFDLQDNAVHKLARNTAVGNSVLKVMGGSGELRVKGDGDCENTNNSYQINSDEVKRKHC